MSRDTVQLTDTKENTIFGFLYVKEFEWMDPLDKESHGGQPKKGRVYRSIYNNQTNSYRLYYELGGQLTGLYLPQLHSIETENYHVVYTSSIVPLSRTTILDCDITPEDVEQLCKWIDDDNKEIKTLTGLKNEVTPRPVSGQEIAKAFAQVKDEYFLEFIAGAKQLKDTNSTLFEGVANCVHFFNSLGEDNSGPLEYNKTTGTGRNIGKAMDHLKNYTSENRRVNLDPNDLMLATKSILSELMRAIVFDQD